jgi:hypothetical protein
MGKSSRNKRKKGGAGKRAKDIPHYFKPNEHDQVFVPDIRESVEHTHSQTISDFDKEHSHPIKKTLHGQAISGVSGFHPATDNPEKVKQLKEHGTGWLSEKAFNNLIQGNYREWIGNKDFLSMYQGYLKTMNNTADSNLLVFYLNWLQSNNVIRRSPWQAEGERLCAIMQAGTVIQDGSDEPAFGWMVQDINEIKFEVAELQVAMVHLLSSSHCKNFLFRDEVIKTATAMPLPKHTINTDLLPMDSMFWVFETPYPINIEAGKYDDDDSVTSLREALMAGVSSDKLNTKWIGADGKEYPSDTGLIDWLVIWKGKDAINVAISVRGISNTVNVMLRYENGQTYDDKTGLIPDFLFSMLAFINTPMIHKAKEENPRRVRKQMERTNKNTKQSLPDGKQSSVVYLRRPQAKKVSGKPTEGKKRDFQWWVSGHYRSQWYSSTQTHKLIWIAPFLKGEEGMPVKDITYIVVR